MKLYASFKYGNILDESVLHPAGVKVTITIYRNWT